MPSESEDGFNFDDSGADITIKYNDLESSDSENKLKIASKTLNLNTKY